MKPMPPREPDATAPAQDISGDDGKTNGQEPTNHRLNERIAGCYEELKRMARKTMRDQGRDHTLQATALVNEVYLRLEHQTGLSVEEERRFLGLVAMTMRSILIDHAKRKKAKKRTADGERVTLDTLGDELSASCENPKALEEATRQLKELQARAAEVVDLHFFAGLSFKDIAELLGVSVKTISRDWRFARAFLLAKLS